jgi:hypothetical protein
MLVATAQADQYWRDAQATATAQQAALEANFRQIAATSQAGTATAAWQATSQAISLQATEQSIQATGTAQAIELAALASAATAEIQQTAIAQVATAEAQEKVVAVQATRQALELARARFQAQREKVVTAVTSALVILATTLVAALLLWLIWRLIPTLVTRTGLTRYGQHGNPLLILQRKGRTVVTDPVAMLQSTVIVDENAAVSMPELAPNEIQTLITGGRLRLLMEQAKYAPGHQAQLPAEVTNRRRVGPVETEKIVRHRAVSLPTVNLPASEQLRIDNNKLTSLPTTTNWDQLEQWHGPGLALGAGSQNEIVAIDLARTPHLFAAGMTGSGKTRRLLRPLVAQALASGYFVILMNESGADFNPFYNHPNITIVRGTASDYMAVFVAAMDEMERREGQLRSARVSEWGRLPPPLRAGQPLLLLALDELLALAMLLSPAEQRQFWSLVAAFASRARKVGMCSVGLATDPTYRALGQGGLTYRSQCARISFRVMQAASSRAILDEGGAEALADGQFMALLASPGVVHGVTANPSDEELRSYLARNPAQTLAPPDWLDLESQPDRPQKDETEQLIRELAGQGLSMRAVQQEVFGYAGGKAYDTVKPIYEEVKAMQDDVTVTDTAVSPR